MIDNDKEVTAIGYIDLMAVFLFTEKSEYPGFFVLGKISVNRRLERA